tara:strand:+ start:651 stop:2363 length:1713 start_codon:yes stop_codon:yes gene_type:complete
MVFFNRPTVTRTYTQVLTDLDAKIDAATGLLSSDVTAYDNQGGTYPVRSIRWNASSNKFERRNSANSGWENLSSNHTFTAITTSGNITSSSGSISGVDITASDELQAARVNVTGSTKPANGLYRPATNEIRLTTNSNDRLTIESNGEVGIGVVDPAQKLHVNGNARITNGTEVAHLELGKSGGGDHASNFSMYSDNSTNYGFRIIRASGTNGGTELTHNGTGNLTLETVDAADILFKTGTNTRMVIDSGGRVCIGTDTSPDDFLHVHQGTGDPVYIRVQNNEGYTTFGTDGNASLINAETHNLRNRAGSSTYLIASTSLFDIKTAAKVNGNLQVTSDLTTNDLIVTDFIQPSVGNSDSKGILFPQNPGGGSGDKAFIRYYVEAGENTKLHIGINNDADDDIYLESSLVHTSGAFTVNGTCTATTFVGAVTGTASNATTFLNKTLSASGNRFDVVPFVASDGVMEIGFMIDFHTSDGSTSDHAGRLKLEGGNFSFDQSVLPSGSHNLGSSSARWQNLYINDLQLSNKGQKNDVDGTWGDYTIQEGENDLYLLNRRNGKAYKFNLTEVGQVS